MLFKIFFKNILRSWQTSWRGWLLPGKPALPEDSELQHRRNDEAAAAAQHGGARGHWREIRQAEEHDAEEHPRQRKVKNVNCRFFVTFLFLKTSLAITGLMESSTTLSTPHSTPPREPPSLRGWRWSRTTAASGLLSSLFRNWPLLILLFLKVCCSH